MDERVTWAETQLQLARSGQAVMRVFLKGGTRSRNSVVTEVGGNRNVAWAAVTNLLNEGKIVDTGLKCASGGALLALAPHYAGMTPLTFASPPEEMFWLAAGRLHDAGLVPQYPVGRYRIDFAIPSAKFGIEIDGLAWHNGQESFVRDRSRQRELEADGWRVVRFAAKEVIDDADDCAAQAHDLLLAHLPAKPRLSDVAPVTA